MKAKPEPQSPVDPERFRKDIELKLSRLLAETIDGWRTCPNPHCRRAQRCASQDYECIALWRESLPPLSPEEAEARKDDYRIAFAVRNRLGGDSVSVGQLAKAIDKEKAARRAAMRPLEGSRPPVAEKTALAPEAQARIDRASHDDVTSPPAEQDRARERRPRITQL